RQCGASAENLTGQQRAIEAYLDVLAAARGSGPVDALRWGSALARVSRLTAIPVEELNRRFGKTKPTRTMTRPTQQAEPASESPLPKPAVIRPLTGQAMAERWILGVLLLEPGRWQHVQQIVHLEDFQDETHRRLAETYWNHQRDEGEPVFNEFIGALGDKDKDLVEIAVTAAEEVETL